MHLEQPYKDLLDIKKRRRITDKHTQKELRDHEIVFEFKAKILKDRKSYFMMIDARQRIKSRASMNPRSPLLFILQTVFQANVSSKGCVMDSDT